MLLEIVARDGYRLGATLFRPTGASNGRALQIHAAAGVKQEYYAQFAGYLTERGFTVLTFDYRGVGRSAPANVKQMNVRLRDWAEIDSAAALDFLHGIEPQAKLLAVGHSFGGAAFALVPGNERLSAVLAVASQSCYWRHWPAPWRPGMWLLTHALVPATTRLFGYFPGAAMGQAEHLPAGVADEWASWCRNPQYLTGALCATERFAGFRRPFRLYSIADDIYAPRAAGEALMALYPNARFDFRSVQPQDAGAGRIGHFGFFRPQFRDNLWRDAAEWLERQE